MLQNIMKLMLYITGSSLIFYLGIRVGTVGAFKCTKYSRSADNFKLLKTISVYYLKYDFENTFAIKEIFEISL